MLARVIAFLIDQWLWSVTWGIYHVPIAAVLMAFCGRFFLRLNTIAAVFISVGSMVVSFLLYSVFVAGFLVCLLGYGYQEQLQGQGLVSDPLYACLYSGLIYTFLQTVFFCGVNRYYPISISRMAVAACIVNLVAAGLVYLVVPHSVM